MDFTVLKEQILPPLLTVFGAVDKRQSMPILANLLIDFNDSQLTLCATDLEIQIKAAVIGAHKHQPGAVTVPAKKLLDIIRSLDDEKDIHFSINKQGLKIKQGRSHFKLSVLPASDYPATAYEPTDFECQMARDDFYEFLQATHFAMSQQDVRIFLNGLYVETQADKLISVATDGHRLALHALPWQSNNQQISILMPKKGVHEMLRLLNTLPDAHITFSVGDNQCQLKTHEFTLISRLIDAKFPAYRKAIPKQQDKSALVDKDIFKRSLNRVMILSNEKTRGITLTLKPNQLGLSTYNQAQEEAQEIIECETQGDEITISLNASYLLDILNHFDEGMVDISFKQSDSSILVKSDTHPQSLYVIMPMRI